jgi:hypothetical protein
VPGVGCGFRVNSVDCRAEGSCAGGDEMGRTTARDAEMGRTTARGGEDDGGGGVCADGRGWAGSGRGKIGSGRGVFFKTFGSKQLRGRGRGRREADRSCPGGGVGDGRLTRGRLRKSWTKD